MEALFGRYFFFSTFFHDPQRLRRKRLGKDAKGTGGTFFCIFGSRKGVFGGFCMENGGKNGHFGPKRPKSRRFSAKCATPFSLTFSPFLQRFGCPKGMPLPWENGLNPIAPLSAALEPISGEEIALLAVLGHFGLPGRIWAPRWVFS